LAVAVFPGLAGAKPLRADPLFDAAERGNHDGVQKALMAGSSANVRGGGSTALIVSARIGAGDVVELLLAHGAIVDLVDDEGNSALIHGAVNDHDDIIRALLDAGAAINHANKQGETALMRAAGAGSQFAVEALLAAGAEPALTDFTGRTALDLARQNRRNRIVRTFQKAGIRR
jgi:ankyrin repeat protein